jgi:hypothetical protein
MNEQKKHEPNPSAGITPELKATLDRLWLAQATALLCDSARIEQGLSTEIGVVRSVTTLEDALQLLQEETEDAEEM